MKTPRRARNSPPSTPLKDFFNRIDISSGDECFRWKIKPGRKGYGKFYDSHRKKYFSAHRWIYEYVNGSIKLGLVLDHKCRNRICVNPFHLRVVTPKINATENSSSIPAVNTTKTHCPKGHEYSGVNFIGRRICAECRRVQNLEYYYRNRAELRSKLHCRNGHLITEENTYFYKNTHHCRICRRIRERKPK